MLGWKSLATQLAGDFDDPQHQKLFLERLEAECPDGLFLSPSCGPWSTMQNLNARTEEQQHQLQELREWHHSRHLRFVKKAYLTQVRQGGHAHVEQPAHALPWRTSALVKLPGYHCVFDQCRFGCSCQNDEGDWLLVKKPHCHFRPPSSVFKEFHQVRCTGDHHIVPWKARPLDLAVEHGILRAINLALLQFWRCSHG